MATLADSLVSSSARQLPLRMRPDLSAREHRYQGRLYWIVKDPVGLHYFRFQEEEYAILTMLDGHTSLDQLKEQFEKRFPPQKITVEELGQFVGTLHKSSLVVSDVGGQGYQLHQRRKERKRKELLNTLSNVLALRFKGIDPDSLLEWMHPKLKWMYSRWAVTCCLLLFASALSLVLVQFNVFRARLPSFHEFFTAQNWIWLGLSLAVTKIIHEFGHGLTCKHYGGECHEMGVMLLVLTPCLYCNVSDSWMLPNKWHRAFIGMGGMYIELVIASICTFVWWYTNPGLLNNVCLSTMFVCSISTVMFNANPLLRYDGYYILADIVEIPNLRQKSSTLFTRKASEWCLGMEQQEDPFLPQRNQFFFILYSIAAGIYRWVVLFSIIWFLYKVFEPYGLKIISQMLATASIAGLVITPLWKIGKFFYVPGRLHQVKRKNLLITLSIVAAMGLAIAYVPLPYRIICTLEVKARDAESVYVGVPGRLQFAVKEGTQVQPGTVLGQLKNVDLAAQLIELEGKLKESETSLESLYRQERSSTISDQITSVSEQIKSLKEQIVEKKNKLARLTLKSQTAGTVLPPPGIPDKHDPSGQLPSWTGSPLELKNLGAQLREETLFCQIGDPRKMEAVLVVEQDDVDFLIREDQEVEIILDSLPEEVLTGRISEIANKPLEIVPPALSNKSGGEVITKTDPSGVQRPQNTSYQAKVPLPDHDLLQIGLRGRAKIHARWQTIWERGSRLFMRTFNFKL